VGDPPTNTPTNDFHDLILSYTRWEPTYNVRKRIQIVDAVNADNFVIRFGDFQQGGFGHGDPNSLGIFGGECRCSGYEPVGEYDESQSLVQVVYEFRMRARMMLDETMWASGFDWRFLDQGTRGIYEDTDNENITTPRLGEFYLRSDTPATEPVRLDGFGVPLREEIKVTKQMLPAIEFTTPPAGASLDRRFINADPRAVFLIYQRKRRIPFKGIIPIFI
jgi:hypothetical protein